MEDDLINSAGFTVNDKYIACGEWIKVCPGGVLNRKNVSFLADHAETCLVFLFIERRKQCIYICISRGVKEKLAGKLEEAGILYEVCWHNIQGDCSVL